MTVRLFFQVSDSGGVLAEISQLLKARIWKYLVECMGITYYILRTLRKQSC